MPAFEFYDRERNRLISDPTQLGGPRGQNNFDNWDFSRDMAQRTGRDPQNFMVSGGDPFQTSGFRMNAGSINNLYGIQDPAADTMSNVASRGMLPSGASREEVAAAMASSNWQSTNDPQEQARLIGAAIQNSRNSQNPEYESPRQKRQREKQESRDRRRAEKEARREESRLRREGRIYEDAAGRDFQNQKDAIDRANEERRGYAEGSSEAIDQRISSAQESGEDMIANAEALMERGLKEFDKLAKTSIKDLNNQNMQYQAESTAGLRQSIQGQISSIDRDPTLTPAQKQQMKAQMQNQVSSQVASVVGKAQRETQQMRAQMRTAFSGQRANLSQAMSGMVQNARSTAMQNNARALEFAAQGRMALSELMSQPDRVLSEFDSLINIGNAMESQGLDFDASRFSNRNFSNDGDMSWEDRRQAMAQNERFM
jgi:hypothetical protein